jgi:hypothetical protein
MFDVDKIQRAAQQIEKVYGFSGTDPNPEMYVNKINLLAPFLNFVEALKSGFKVLNHFGSIPVPVSVLGTIYLHSDYLSDNKVTYAGIVQGEYNGMMNLFMIVKVGEYTYSINTNVLRKEHDRFRVQSVYYPQELLNTVSPVSLDSEYVFHSFDMGYRGSIIECLQYFNRVTYFLPDKLKSGYIKWTKNNICYLQGLIHKPELLYDTELAESDQQSHPELLDGEMWFCNLIDIKFHSLLPMENPFFSEYKKIQYQSKRIGKVAYSKEGVVALDYVPVFISIEEYNEKFT